MENTCKVFIKVDENGKHPVAGSRNSAGLDLFASQDMVIKPSETKIMPLNFSMALPEGCEAQIRPRSGLSAKTKLRIANSPGTIDADYRDTVGVIIENTYNVANLPYELLNNELTINMKYVKIPTGKKTVKILVPLFLDEQGNPYGTIYIKKGERIGQMVIAEYKKVFFIDHENPREIGGDRGGGFGSTGV